MVQKRGVEESEPHDDSPLAAEDTIPEKSDEVSVRELMVITPGSIQKRKVKSNPPLDSHRGTVAFCYVGPLLKQAEDPTQPPRWGLSIWPEQDKEQYKQHVAQIQIPNTAHL